MDFTEPFTFTETTSKTYTVYSYNYHIDQIKLNSTQMRYFGWMKAAIGMLYAGPIQSY